METYILGTGGTDSASERAGECMTVFLLLYLCTDASRSDCQVIAVEHWVQPDAYQQCVAAARQLTKDLTAKNRQSNYFVCETQASP